MHQQQSANSILRQMHTETSGHGLSFNDHLTFVDTNFNAYQHFMRFFKTCAAKHVQRIKHITLFDGPTCSLYPSLWNQPIARLQGQIGDTSGVQDIARDFPHINIVVRLELGRTGMQGQINPKPLAYMDAAYLTRHGVRAFPDCVRVQHTSESTLVGRLFLLTHQKNVRFSCAWAFHEALVRAELNFYLPSPMSLEVRDSFVATARKLHEDGI
jgi:hypothetical protein